jgi:hypothetical protein
MNAQNQNSMSIEESFPDAASKPKTSKPGSPKRRLQSQFDFLARLLVAVGVMTWGAFNLFSNVLEYRAVIAAKADAANAGGAANVVDQQWAVSYVFLLLTAVVPFLFGLWLLIRATARPVSR